MLKVVSTVSELRALRANLPGPVGFVPTMGFLHEGHLSLVKAAHRDCTSVVVSIFVNPTQFGPKEDLAAYPRDLDCDLALLREEGVDLVFAPTVVDLYPEGFQSWVTVDSLTQPLEGSLRPGHFRGVATVVAKLFNIVQPDKAYFGQKDAQQAVVIRRMIRDLNIPVDMMVCPIVRESDGLAKSSRNTYLNPQERQAAVVLSRGLQMARQAFAAGERDANHLRQIVLDEYGREPLARVQYVSCADPDTLEELEKVQQQALISVAVFMGPTRLIDNILLS